MTGQPGGQDDREDARGQRPDEPLNPEGAGMGMGGDATTFEPEETPEAVDEPDGRQPAGAGASGLGDVVDPRELVPDDDRVDEVELPREVLPDAERGVDDGGPASESDRLLPDAERPVPGGPADD